MRVVAPIRQRVTVGAIAQAGGGFLVTCQGVVSCWQQIRGAVIIGIDDAADELGSGLSGGR